MQKAEHVGQISNNVIKLLELESEEGTPIFMGDTNILHMKNKHPLEFKKYGNSVADIIAKPDYVGINKDDSIEYVKDFFDDDRHEYIKLAVRVSTNGLYFVRSLYAIPLRRILNRVENNKLYVVE